MPEAPRNESERFARLEAILDAALERAPEQRAAFVADRCADDPALAREATAMLAAIDESEGFLEAAAAQPATVGKAGWKLGVWRLVRRIGSGGMGEVWLAERDDGRFEQHVAVKLMRHAGGTDIPRFVREQRLLARLQHPGIARLLDAGSAPDGRPYMVMEYVEGETLPVHCDRLQLDIPARLRLFMQLCEAVAYAHRLAIVHRDLKPANVMVRSDGRLALLDFGIARLVDAQAPVDAGADHSLTPQYAAPEQLTGGEETTLTDVYALGLLLYELLCGRLPWHGAGQRSSLALMARAFTEAAEPPSANAATPALMRSLQGDLDAIVMKALQAAPDARYASVDALREDIARHLEWRPVKARGNAFGYRLRRGLHRHRAAAIVAAVVLAGLLGALLLVTNAQRETARERDIAQTEAKRSKAVRDYLSHMFRDARQQAREGEPLTAREVLNQAATRVDASFRDDPAAAADVLKALGELHFYINDYAAAEPLLRRWLQREDDIADPVAAADVRFTLAEVLHRMGRDEEARPLLDAAQTYWAKDPARHADVLLTSRMLQSQLERANGDIEHAVRTLEASLPLRLQRSGDVHFETAVLYNNLGAAYVAAGRLDDARQSLEHAQILWTALQMEHGADALNTLNNLAAIYFRQGDLDAAETAFREALSIRRRTQGRSAATAALMNNLARVLQRQDKPGEALVQVREAKDMALEHAGEDSPLVLAARITEAELLLALGRPAEAGPLLDTLEITRAEGLAPPTRFRIGLARADYFVRTGATTKARATIAALQAMQSEHGFSDDASTQRMHALEQALESGRGDG